jgi:hypothetical protein
MSTSTGYDMQYTTYLGSSVQFKLAIELIIVWLVECQVKTMQLVRDLFDSVGSALVRSSRTLLREFLYHIASDTVDGTS